MPITSSNMQQQQSSWTWPTSRSCHNCDTRPTIALLLVSVWMGREKGKGRRHRKGREMEGDLSTSLIILWPLVPSLFCARMMSLTLCPCRCGDILLAGAWRENVSRELQAWRHCRFSQTGWLARKTRQHQVDTTERYNGGKCESRDGVS